VPDLSRRHGVAENTIYRCKPRFGGMEVSEAKRLRELEAENSKLKRLLADGFARWLATAYSTDPGHWFHVKAVSQST